MYRAGVCEGGIRGAGSCVGWEVRDEVGGSGGGYEDSNGDYGEAEGWVVGEDEGCGRVVKTERSGLDGGRVWVDLCTRVEKVIPDQTMYIHVANPGIQKTLID